MGFDDCLDEPRKSRFEFGIARHVVHLHAMALAAEGTAVIVNYASSKAGADTVVGGMVAAGLWPARQEPLQPLVI